MTEQEILERARARRQQAFPSSAPSPSGMTEEEILERARLRREAQQAQGQGFLGRTIDAVQGTARAVGRLVRGQQDPRFADLPAIDKTQFPLEVQQQINRGELVTFDDEAYGDVVRNALGPRYVGTERDAHDYQVMTFLDNEGKEQQAYLNRPGLDMQDIDRGIAGSVPFMLGAGVANTALRGIGMTGAVPRMLAQGTAGATASIASDQAAANMGSEQGTDLGRAALAGGAGALFEGLSGPIARAWSSLFRRGGVGPDGKLTGETAEAARRMGLDPDDMAERIARQFERDMRVAESPSEVAGKFRSGEFDIPTSYGQRTKDPASLGVEEEMRRGLMGREAQGIMQDFDRRQRQAVEGAVYDHLGRRIAPDASGRDMHSLGSNIRAGTQAAKESLDMQQNAVWERVGRMYPEEGSFASMPGILRERVNAANVVIDPELTPAAHRALQDLGLYARGKPQQQRYDLLPEDVKAMDIDTMRRRLLRTAGSAQNDSDRRAANAVYNGFNEWIDEAAERAVLAGSPDSAAALRAARGFTREMKELFQPSRQGKPTAGARRIERVMSVSDSPEGVVRALFGEGAPVRTPQEGTVEAIRHMRRILTENGQEQAWNDIRMAYWLRIAQDNKGQVLTAGRLRNNIEGALNSQKSVVDELFTGQERLHMERLSKALSDIVYTPPNPSGTSYELARMMRSGGEPMLKTALSAQSKRELFSKGNVLMSRFYSMLARKIPNVAGVGDAAGRSIARGATSQEVMPLRQNATFIAPLVASGTAQTRDLD